VPRANALGTPTLFGVELRSILSTVVFRNTLIHQPGVHLVGESFEAVSTDHGDKERRRKMKQKSLQQSAKE
jgi:hypothetical protein